MNPNRDLDTAPETPVDLLLLECLESGAERVQTFEQACLEHPEHADELRRRWELLSSVGLMESAIPAHIPERLGDYRLLSKLGMGGMGVVYLAEQISLPRQVAIKLMRPSALDDPAVRMRFDRECALLSRLDHPSICPIYEIGEEQGIRYMVMRYVEGQTLSQLIKVSRGSSLSECRLKDSSSNHAGRARAEIMQVVETAARAVHTAHEKGLIHRDLKPANIVIDPEGNPVLLDFGLARDENASQSSLTGSGAALGTPAYMPPEQIGSANGPLDRRADVYALGVVLYECLTLERPFSAVGRHHLYNQILSGRVADPRRVNPSIPRDLATVVMKAMERNVERRYATALEFAQELERIRTRQPILARPAGVLLRTRRWQQRNPVVSVFVGLLLAGLSVTLLLLLELSDSLQHTRNASLVLAAREANETSPLLGLLLANEAVDGDATAEAVSQLHEAVATTHEFGSLDHSAVVWDAAWSPDGNHIATAADPGTVRIWDPFSDSEPTVVQVSDWVHSVSYSPSGKLLAVAGRVVRILDSKGQQLATLGQAPSDDTSPLTWLHKVVFSPVSDDLVLALHLDGSSKLWNWRDGTSVDLERHQGPVKTGAFSPDGTRVVTAVGFNADWLPPNAEPIARVSGIDGRTICDLRGHSGSILSAVFSPDGSMVLTASADRTVRLWDSTTGAELHRWQQEHPFLAAEFDAAQTRILGSSRDGTLWLWDLDTFALQRSIHVGHPGVTGQLSRDGLRILAVDFDARAVVYDLEGRVLTELIGHKGSVWGARFAPDERSVVTWSFDGTARVWRVVDPELPVYHGHTEPLKRIAISKDGRYVLSAGEDRSARIWSSDGSLLQVLPHDDAVCDVQFDSSGKLILTCQQNQVASLWSWQDGVKLLGRFPIGPPGFRFASARFLPGDRILVLPRLGNPSILDYSGQTLQGPFEGDGDGAPLLAVAPSQEMFATASLAGVAQIWSLAADGTATPEAVCAGHEGSVGCVNFSPDGTLLVTASRDKTARIWNLAGEPLAILRGHDAIVTWAEFAPDGMSVLTSSIDGTARVWGLDGEPLLVLRCQQGPLHCATFTPDGSRILTGGNDGTMHTWMAHVDDLVDLAKRRAWRDFEPAERARFADLIGGLEKETK